MANPAFEKNIRRIEGELDINFFANGTDNAVSIETNRSTTNHGISIEHHARQIFSPNLEINKKVATFDGNTNLPNQIGIPLDGSAHLVGNGSNIGWIGNARSLESTNPEINGNFISPQVLEVEFLSPRILRFWEIRGIQNRRHVNGVLVTPNPYVAEFPANFRLTITFTDAIAYVANVTNNDKHVCRWNFREGVARDCECNVTPCRCEPMSVPEDFNFERPVSRVRLEITKWSQGGVLPQLTYFSSEMNEWFDGSSLKSIEVVEEKAGRVDELSYGISSNYCKASFLNYNKQFYKKENYDLLKRNRRVTPFIRCGGQHQLGEFFSEEWQLDDKSLFMSCKAYDVMYGLQDFQINYGMRLNPRAGVLVEPYKNITIDEVLHTVFSLINDERRKGNMFEDILPNREQLCSVLKSLRLPYVLIEEKSAWAVLQDIANFCCAYIYADRNGDVRIESDNFRSPLPQSPPLPEPPAARRYNKVKAIHSIRDENSIKINGIHEHNCDATLFVTTETREVPKLITTMAENILQKYKNGINFVDTEWKGDVGLNLGSAFNARSIHEEYDENDPQQIFECLSNEMTLKNGFRQRTKGKVIKDGVRNIKSFDNLPNAQNLLPLSTISNTFSFPARTTIASIVTGVQLEANQQYLIEINYSTAIFIQTRFIVGSGANANQFRYIASQGREGLDRTARIIFTPIAQDLQGGSNLILRFQRNSSTNLVNTSLTLTSISLKKIDQMPPVITETTKIAPVVEITPENSFDYSLPVVSRTIVNQVNVEYYVLEEVGADEDKERITVNRRDCQLIENSTNRFRAILKFKNVYERINSLSSNSGEINSIIIHSATASSLVIDFIVTTSDFNDLTITIN